MEKDVMATNEMKYCKYCGEKIPKDSVICIHCGRQVEEVKMNSQPNVIINNDNHNISSNQNSNVNSNTNIQKGKSCNKFVSLMLCIFLGFFGAHKFYEGKTGMGLLYLFTAGIFCIDWIVDIFAILVKPSTYYV